MPSMKFLNPRVQIFFLRRRQIEIAIQLPQQNPISSGISELERTAGNQQGPQKQQSQKPSPKGPMVRSQIFHSFPVKIIGSGTENQSILQSDRSPRISNEIAP